MTRGGIALPDGYPELLGTLKRRVRDAQGRAQRTVNTQLIELYWSIGRSILSEQENQGWGAGVMDRLARLNAREDPTPDRRPSHVTVPHAHRIVRPPQTRPSRPGKHHPASCHRLVGRQRPLTE